MSRITELDDAGLLPIPSTLHSDLDTLAHLSQLPVLLAQDWIAVRSNAQALADSLRSEELRTALGSTSLIGSCSTLLRSEGGQEGKVQLLRVLGNLCFDHDVNRGVSLEAGAVEGILDVLASSDGRGLDALTLIRAAVGALLNMSLKYSPIHQVLLAPEPLSTLLSLVAPGPRSVYAINQWNGGVEGEVRKAEIQMGGTIVGWVMSIIEDLIELDKDAFNAAIPSSAIPLLSSLILSSQTPPPSPSSSWTSSEATSLLETDLDLLTSSASLVESLALALDTAKESIAFDLLPSSNSTVLSSLFDFIESSHPPSHWSQAWKDEDGVVVDALKVFTGIKASVVRAVVEAPNSDVVMARLFAAQAGERNPILERLVRWVREPKEGREDLLICAAHMLAAFGRKDEHCIALVKTYGLAQPLASLVEQKVEQQFSAQAGGGRTGETTQILYGVVGLLRHLAIPSVNRGPLGRTGLVGFVTPLLRSELDIVAQLQNATIGLLKHLVAGQLRNALEFINVLPRDRPSALVSTGSPLDAVLAIIGRTDDIRLRSEATRVLSNVILVLFTPSSPSTSSTSPTTSPIPIAIAGITSPDALISLDDLMKQHRSLLASKGVINALSELVRTTPHAMLVNEGVVGLTLLSADSEVGATLVLEALLSSHPTPPAPVDPTSPTASPTSTPPTTSLSILISYLNLFTLRQCLEEGSREVGVREEMVTNVAGLVLTLLSASTESFELEVREGEEGKVMRGERDARREETKGLLREPLERLVEARGEDMWDGMAGRVLALVRA